eukprot:CAMPEP_0202860684 /NCGR_PEP_ID=MMETSP1391-20130828/2313_1 /ASSEMBLY_ACC=CAM_ASM_000867 /TAXON_ID=1034604 /ORGANISM="Chlamydomonas leiostraca, Strain SAG 11-49" /LENGTH=292 /DNA_ID=CAMNT_0049539907 /DNA_START=226 /DNA_END=1105 /DNA_ORIENTATION=-
MRVVSIGEECEIRIEDPNTDQEFAVCPVPYGKRTVSVEAVSDSSRYFVLRVEDRATKRHAFLGMGFDQRGDAFDFNEALMRHEKFVERSRAAAQVGASGGELPGASGAAGGRQAPQAGQAAALREVAALYAHHGDLGLKAGQTIHVNFKPKAKAGEGGNAAGAPGPSAPTIIAPLGQGFKLAPPPGVPAVPAAQPAHAAADPLTQGPWGGPPASAGLPAGAAAGSGFDPFAGFPSSSSSAAAATVPAASAPAAPTPTAPAPDGWASLIECWAHVAVASTAEWWASGARSLQV